MNKVILMGRLVRDPEVRYSQGAEPFAVARYTLAVSRRIRKEGEPEADFINCVALGKSGEFVERFFRKGQMISIVGGFKFVPGTIKTEQNTGVQKCLQKNIILLKARIIRTTNNFIV